MTRPKKRKRPRPPCVVCEGRFTEADTKVSTPIGTAHADCAESLEEGIEAGGCDRETYYRIYSSVMGSED